MKFIIWIDMICLINLPLSLGNPAVMYRNCVVFHYLTRDWFRMLSIYIYRVSRYCARMTIYSINILQLFIFWFLISYICIFCQFSLLFLFYIFAIQDDIVCLSPSVICYRGLHRTSLKKMAMGPLYLIPLHESAVGVQPFW